MTKFSQGKNRPSFNCSGIFVVLFLVVWMIVSVVLVVSMIRTYIRSSEEYRLLQSDNRLTQARITDRWTESDDDDTDYFIAYVYSAPVGNQTYDFPDQQDVGKKLYDRYLRADTLPLRYYPPDPAIHLLEDRYGPPSMLPPILSLLFPLFGIGFITVLLLSRRSNAEVRAVQTANPLSLNQASLEGSDFFYQASKEAFSCPVCRRPLSEGLLDCPHRASGQCPYVEDELSTRPFHNFGIGTAIFGALLIAAGLTFFTDALQCLLPFGVLLFLVGLFLSLSFTSGLADPKTGQRWFINRLFRWTLYESASGPVQVLTFDPPGTLRRLPPSLAALTESDHSAFLIHRSLILLAADGLLEICYAPLRTTSPITGERLSLSFSIRLPETPAPVPQPDGALEKKILAAVNKQAAVKSAFIRSGNTSRMRDNPYRFSVKDLVMMIFGSTVSQPATHLIHNLVGEDAASRGLGRMEGRLFKRFLPNPQAMRAAETQNEEDRRVVDAFTQRAPELANALAAACTEAVKAMESSD